MIAQIANNETAAIATTPASLMSRSSSDSVGDMNPPVENASSVKHTPRTASRAQAIRDMVEIRLADNEFGPAIAEVLKENGIVLERADWSKVFPHWLIATVDEDVIGCCQIVVSQPVGYVEFMFVRPSAPFKLRAIAIRKLMIQSITALRLAGCSYVGGFVAQSNRKFSDVIGKLGFVKAFQADLYVKRFDLQ